MVELGDSLVRGPDDRNERHLCIRGPYSPCADEKSEEMLTL